ncbi:MAG: UPF0280 family protein [Syntrophales bacterium]
MEKKPADYLIRAYRNNIVKNNLKVFNVSIEESDIFVSADYDLAQESLTSLYKARQIIEACIKDHADFLTSLKPINFEIMPPSPVSEMLQASREAGVGPMAAVAGTIAEYVGRELRKYSRNVIIENGGDIYADTASDIQIGIFAGESPLSERVAIHIKQEEMPIGICTSSGTVGHSLSFGKADVCCVKAKSAALADAAATAVGNMVKSVRDIKAALEQGMKIGGVLGIVIIVGEHLGAIGDITMLET